MTDAAEKLAETRRAAALASFGHSSDAIYRAVLAALREQPRAANVLDFGAGDGSLTRELSKLCDRVVAVDLVNHIGSAAAPAAEWVAADLNTRLPFRDGEFDTVVAAEVIEHLENPRFVAREWFRVLRPGGLVVVTTPNNESWRSILSLLVRGHFASFSGTDYPAHITALVREDLARVLIEAGFQKPQFAFTDHGAIPRLTSVTWQRFSRGRLRGLRFSDNLCCCALKPNGREKDDR